MKFLVLFAATFLCVQAYHIPYGYYGGSSESSEEEYRVLVTANNQHPLNLPGVGVYSQPILQAVKVKVPRYISPEIKQQIITQTLAARGLTLHAAPPAQSGLINVAPTDGLIVRQQRELPATATQHKCGTMETGAVPHNAAVTEERKEMPVPVVPEVPIVSAILDA